MFLLHWPSVHFRIIFLVTVNRLKGKYQVTVVQKVDSAIHWINHYPVDITQLVFVILSIE